ncbi:MAG: HAD family hydrolase [Planctomycetales bacterium]|nr:HAD family hydrolase [Planctomycetales bacterium]
MDLRRVLLLILDLDDTLFDCAGTLVPAAHRDAAAALAAAGVPASAEAILAARLEVFAADARADVDAAVCARYGVTDSRIAEVGRRAFLRREVPPIEPFPGVRETLAKLEGRVRRVLVSVGWPETQRRKVERLGLGPLLDRTLYLAPKSKGGKEVAFRSLLNTEGLRPAGALVVGNRLDDEIAAGKRLGIPTALVRGGELGALEPRGPDETPDVVVAGLPELLPMLGVA